MLTISVFIVAIAFITANNYRLLERSLYERTNSVLDMFATDITMQINHLNRILETTEEALAQKHLSIGRAVANLINDAEDISNDFLRSFCEPYGIVELTVANSEGTITHSNIEDFIGFNYGSTEQTQKYMALLYGTVTELHEKPRASVIASPLLGDMSHYIGIARKGGGFYQIGYDVEFLLGLRDQINIDVIIKETVLGKTGYGFVLQGGKMHAHPSDTVAGMDMSKREWFGRVSTGEGYGSITIDGVDYYAKYRNQGDYTIVGVIPEDEFYKELRWSLINNLFFALAASVVMIVLLYFSLRRLLQPINTVTNSLSEIAKGNFSTKIEGHYTDEFALIKNAVNEMVSSINTHLNDKLQAERNAHRAELARIDLLLKVHYDSLTNIHNRRYLDENFGRIIRKLSRSGGTISVIMADIDNFKQFNDTYGHDEGDVCLRIVAQTLRESVTREDDFVVRYGGEEFCVVLPNTDKDGAEIVARKIIENIRELKIKNENSKVSEYLTISVGFTTGKVLHTQSGDDYIKRADEALYVSKHNGRDQYTFLPL
ncbi:MAG: diguanylate cyclase [Oscillospiraceae bacterium]|nr:diguanylate cyclase [Oscillospiraceae bacterium]